MVLMKTAERRNKGKCLVWEKLNILKKREEKETKTYDLKKRKTKTLNGVTNKSEKGKEKLDDKIEMANREENKKRNSKQETMKRKNKSNKRGDKDVTIRKKNVKCEKK